MSKEIKVIKREEDEIILQEVSRYRTFYDRYGKYVVLLVLLFLILIGGTIILNLKSSDEYVLDNPNIDIVFPDDDDIIIDTDDDKTNQSEDKKDNTITVKPEDIFTDFLNIPDEVSFKIRTLLLPDKKIVFYSDYTVKISYNSGRISRIFPTNNNYSVDEKGNINPNAKYVNIAITKTEQTNHGTVTYYSDHSAEVEENDLDIWVGKKDNIKEYYITDNKISYSNDIKEYDDFSVTYYHDGTVFINSEDNKYFVRDAEDVIINENGFLFHYENAAVVVDSKKLDNGFIVDYLSDGGAIIEGPDGNVSVRKSNSIIIENNKLVKVKINNVVKESSRKTTEDKEVIYYDNGASIIKQDDKVIGYVEENSDIKYTDDKIINEDVIVPVTNTSTPSEDTTIYIFEDGTAFVDNDVDIFDNKDNVVIEDGVVAIIDKDAQDVTLSRIKITNKSSNKVKIRVVIENSDKTTLQNYYLKDIKYRISANNNDTKSINSTLWEDNSNEYILYETELTSKEEVEYQLGIWLDYANLGNDAMDKYFYGTLKVYSWEQTN